MVRLLFILLLFTGCVTEKKCLERFPPKESFKETIREYYHDTLIPGATVHDTVYFQGKTIERNHWYYKTDTADKAELRYMVDQYGNLIAECSAKDQTIQGLIKEVFKEREKTTIVPDIIIPWWAYLIGCLICLFSFWVGGRVS